MTTMWEGVVSGAVAGAATRLIAAPLDLVKIRLQVHQAPMQTPEFGERLLKAIVRIYGEEGLRTFWRGNVAATGLWVSYSGIQFGCYQALQNTITNHDHKLSWIWYSGSGAIAGVVATMATYPLDLCRTVLASQGVPKAFPTMHAFASHIYTTQGLKGFFQGLSPTIFQIAPYMGISFGIYSTLSDISSKHPILQAIGNGAVAGFMSKLIVYPLDTVKKRMQMQGIPRHEAYGAAIPRYTSSWRCAHDILRHEGVAGFYKGTVPSLIKSGVSHSCTFTVYEITASILRRLHDKD
ncbi:Mitochondrial Carrier (MC) Family [Thraustotheca clavata]|uniref:Mitochondrial Carrier (MC) Family n=1 Tax=Thraustotheca clavata TaxID=74557 RepID=A0A1W0A5C7_9STRA|nr:Mitochondrial Carrier (MC) Family [Thraustotheca clavata]